MIKCLWVILAVQFSIGAVVFANGAAIAKAKQQRRAFSDSYMKTILDEPVQHPVVYALASLYTGKDIKGGNKQLRDALAKIAGDDKKFSPKEAGDESVKWCMRGWLRVYYLFNDKSPFFKGRLEPDVQAKLEELFFLYGSYKSTVARASLKNIWHIHGSENHDMMDFSNAYLALQAVQDLPAYKDKKLPDGHTPVKHVKAWDAYYAQYALERAKNGLFVEISPTYGKWFVGEFVNMYQFSKSPLVRKRMEMLLHLMWADWAVDQLNGVRGGGKTRCYQDHYAQSGQADSWDLMAGELFGIEEWHWNSHGGLSTLALQTSPYELPDVVLDVALNKGVFKPFVYQSTRPGRISRKTARVKENGNRTFIYYMDPKAGGILRYSYCTPEAIMGSWMLDTRTSYAAIHSQNRWQGVIFSTGRAMRVFPQSEGLGKTLQQHVAVQHRNVMIVANHPKAENTGQMQVFFPNALRSRLIEKEGWVVVKEAGAWLGVSVLDESGKTASRNYSFKDDTPKKGEPLGFYLCPKADRPPVVFVVSQVKTHKTIGEFLAYLKSQTYTVNTGISHYEFVDDLGAKTALELGGKLPVPTVNGKPVNLFPKKVFDSPYMSSEHGSGVVEIQKGQRKLVLDFNETDLK